MKTVAWFLIIAILASSCTFYQRVPNEELPSPQITVGEKVKIISNTSHRPYFFEVVEVTDSGFTGRKIRPKEDRDLTYKINYSDVRSIYVVDNADKKELNKAFLAIGIAAGAIIIFYNLFILQKDESF